jgi:metal-dependent hydrolase (beta-lactamase superfamily II)
VSDIFCSIHRMGISCDSRQLYDSKWTFHSSVTFISRKCMKPELMNGTPPGSIHVCHPSEWIQSEIFSQWFLHFIKHTKPTNQDPFILVSGGHYSHTRNLEVISLARENHVDIICLPPHNSHKMQPFDKAFVGPLKTFYSQKTEI